MQGLVLSPPSGYPGGHPNLPPGASMYPNHFGYQIFGMPSFPGSGPASITPLEAQGGGAAPPLPAPEDTTGGPPLSLPAPPLEKVQVGEN